MARKKKRPELKHCKVRFSTHPKAPWRVSYKAEREGQTVTLRKTFATEDAAWIFAEEQDSEISNHGVRYGDIPPEVRRAFDFYRDEKADLESIGASVPRIEDLIADALSAIRTAHTAAQENVISVAEAVALFTEYKKPRVGTRQHFNLTDHLKRFAETFGTRTVPSITATEIDSWLSALRSRKNPDNLELPPLVSPTTRNHYRTSLSTFFKYGKAHTRQWCVHNPLADLEPEDVKLKEPQAYTPEDTAKIMEAALAHRPDVLPVLALGFFAGARSSEAVNVDLGTLTTDTKEFRIDSSKTGIRHATLTPACLAWIQAQPRRKGKAWIQSRRMFVEAVREVLKLAKVEPIHNGARHSFISYRTAELRDVARVADECGNSVVMVKNHYRKLVTGDAAKKYFAIRPPVKRGRKSKVTSIEDGRISA